MSERTCSGCRWFVRHHSSDDSRRHLLPGQCRRYPPVLDNDDGFPGVSEQEFCGEWADRSLTAKEAERRDLIRQFAVAIAGEVEITAVNDIWRLAAMLADYEGQL